MKDVTRVIQKRGKTLNFEKFITAKKAMLLARESGLEGRLEIQHLIIENQEEVLYSMYSINERNKIVCAVYPHRHLIRNFFLDKAISTKPE